MRLYVFVLLVLKIVTVLSNPKGSSPKCRNYKELIQEGRKNCELKVNATSIAQRLVPYLQTKIQLNELDDFTAVACMADTVNICEADDFAVFKVQVNSYRNPGQYLAMATQIEARTAADKPKNRPLKVKIGCYMYWNVAGSEKNEMHVCVAKWKTKARRNQGRMDQKRSGEPTHLEKRPGSQSSRENLSPGREGLSPGHENLSPGHQGPGPLPDEDRRMPEEEPGQQKLKGKEVSQKGQLGEGEMPSQGLGSATPGQDVEDQLSEVDRDGMAVSA